VIALWSLIGVALAQCEVSLPSVPVGERWTDTVAIEEDDIDCRLVDLGDVTRVRIPALKGVIRQWDDSRVRFGRERLVRVGGRWMVELPEWREGDRLKLKLTVEADDAGSLWSGPRQPLGPPDRIEVVWATDGDPVFGADGTVSMRTTHVWSSRTGPGTFIAFSPADTETKACEAETSSVLEIQPFGCAVSLEEGAEGSVSISWMREGAGLSHEWRLAEGQSLRLDGATVSSSASIDPDGVAKGPGVVVVHLESVGGLTVEAVALEEVEVAAKLVSIPEPGLGLRFKGRQLDDGLVRDILSLVQEQVQNGSRRGGHPLKARPLMDVRRSGWATPWEQALLLSRYLGQVKLDAEAFPVRPAASGRAVPGAPEGYTHAVVHVRSGDNSFWLEPHCRTCAAGEISPGLWGGQVFSTKRDRMPEGPQSRR